MNKSEKQNLIVGIIVTALLACAVVAILLGQKRTYRQGEYVVLTELPADAKIRARDPVIYNGEKVGEVTRVSSSKSGASVAVRISVKPEVFHLIGEDAAIWAESTPDRGRAIHLDPGKKGSLRSLIKIKAVKGL